MKSASNLDKVSHIQVYSTNLHRNTGKNPGYDALY
jgi:hypothetical protein